MEDDACPLAAVPFIVRTFFLPIFGYHDCVTKESLLVGVGFMFQREHPGFDPISLGRY
jgi:hypothetical protein